MQKNLFQLKSDYSPAGDQPEAIKSLVKGIIRDDRKQTLLGVTGSGKTFTVANVIEEIQKPTLIIAHNKTLAAQLAQEFREFFPHNAVHYFVSYYDYYQPEAYMAVTDTYIEKDAQINEEIDRLRHASTQALLTRNDVIIIASVSAIYGLGSPEEYKERFIMIHVGQKINRTDFLKHLVGMHYSRTNADLNPGEFRAIGNSIEIMPISEKKIYRLETEGTIISFIQMIDPVSSIVFETPNEVFLYPAKHFITSEASRDKAIKSIKVELTARLKELEKEGKMLEAERLKRRTNYDLAMIREVGYCSGIENYSRHLSGKNAGEPPETLISYFPHDKNGRPEFLTVIDESHVTLPQIRGMYGGDQSRKETLVEYGFRLPSAKDNRPLRYEEFEKRIGQVLYISATPSDYEKGESSQVVEQIIRPTGLIDPAIEIKPVVAGGEYKGQVQDFITQAKGEIERGGRVLATTLTKKMAEDLSAYLKDEKIKAEYIHSDVKTIERIDIISKFRKGEFDILVGVNLLREGLDMPEVSLIGILDADKEGFLRSDTSLIQTIGRAARNVDGRVILYADRITGSMERAIGETTRRRNTQLAYNRKNGITPKTIMKTIHSITEHLFTEHEKTVNLELGVFLERIQKLPQEKQGSEYQKLIKRKECEMTNAVKELDFESASILRDEIIILKRESEK